MSVLGRAGRFVGRAPIELVGLAAVVVAFAAITTIFSLQQPSFFDADEKANVGYAQEIAAFRLPEIETPVDPPAAAVQWRAELDSSRDDRYRAVWVANHPPLNYVLAAPSIWVANALDRADGGLLFLRLQNMVFAAAGVVFTYLLGTELAARRGSGRRRVGLLAAAVVALVPQGYTYFSRALNDGLAFAAATALVWLAIRCSRESPLRRDVVALPATVVVCAGTRAATMLLALVVVGAVAAYRLAVGHADLARRFRAAATFGALAIGPAAVVWGWFYVRNAVLYGDIGASKFLLERFERTRIGSTTELLTWGNAWSDLYRRMASTAPLNWAVPRFASLVAVVGMLGLAAAVAVAVARRDRRQLWAFAVCGLATAAITVTVAQHLAGGGSPYSRYFFPALGALAVLLAIGYDRLLPGIAPILLLAAMGPWLVTKVPIGVDAVTLHRPRDPGLAPAVLQVLPGNDTIRLVCAIVAVLAGALAAAVIAVTGVSEARASLGRLGRGDPAQGRATPTARSANQDRARH